MRPVRVLQALLIIFAMSPLPVVAVVSPNSVNIYDRGNWFNLGAQSAAQISATTVGQPMLALLQGYDADSVFKVFPGSNPADTSFVRPDGKKIRLVDLSKHYMIHFIEEVDLTAFSVAVSQLNTSDIVSPIPQFQADTVIPSDLSATNQPYLFASNLPNRIGATVAWETTTGKTTQRIGIYDEGVDTAHSEFLGRVSGRVHIAPPPDTNDMTHGTAIAGIMLANANNGGMAGLNWNAKLWDIKGYNGDFTSSMPKGVKSADSLAIGFLNISSGAVIPPQVIIPACDFFGSSLADMCYNAWGREMIICASTGNSGIVTPNLRVPWGLSTVVGVGSTTPLDARSTTSNYGWDIDLCAPGENIYRPTPGGGFAPNSGTSFSTPLVTASMSLVKAAREWLTADEVEQIIFATAKDVGNPGYDLEYGHGRLDVGAAVKMASTYNFQRLRDSVPTLVRLDSGVTRAFAQSYNGKLKGGVYGHVVSYSARTTFTFNYGHTPKVLFRKRSVDGWTMDTDTVREIAYLRTVEVTPTHATIETGAYRIDTTANSIKGYWPCYSPPCLNGPNVDIQVTIAACSTPGDADNNCSVSIGDVSFLVAYIFQQGQAPPILNDADVDADGGDCNINIGDVVYLMGYILGGGPAPLNNDCVPTSLKVGAGDNIAATDDVSLTIGADSAGYLPLNVSTVRAINGMSITLKALNGSQVDVISRSAVPLHWSQSGDEVRIGLIDVYGQKFINPSDSTLIAVRGDFEISAVEVAQIDSSKAVQLFKPKFVNGRNTTVNPNAIKQIAFDGISPNPANPSAEVYFSLPAKATVSIEVFNILGQRVATVANREFDPGSHRVRWEGRDDASQQVASGVYFVRMTSGEFTAKKKLLMLK